MQHNRSVIAMTDHIPAKKKKKKKNWILVYNVMELWFVWYAHSVGTSFSGILLCRHWQFVIRSLYCRAATNIRKLERITNTDQTNKCLWRSNI